MSGINASAVWELVWLLLVAASVISKFGAKSTLYSSLIVLDNRGSPVDFIISGAIGFTGRRNHREGVLNRTGIAMWIIFS